MARPKKVKVEETKEEVFLPDEREETIAPTVEAPKFDPGIPENKQRDLR